MSLVKTGITLLLAISLCSFKVDNEYFRVTIETQNESTIISIESKIDEFLCTINGKDINHRSNNKNIIKLPKLKKGVYHIVIYHSNDKYLIKTIKL